MGLKGIKINGTTYQFDHGYLDNLPTVDASPAEGSENAVKSGGVYSALAGKADASATYTKTEVDTVLEGKVDASDAYTKVEVDMALAGKADASATYTKTEVDTALAGKADASDAYTKAEVDTALAGKQNSLTFDSTPVSGSSNPATSGGVYAALEEKADASSVYTKGEVDEALAGKADAADVYTKTEVDAVLEEGHVTLSFDSTPTSGSSNPVTSDGIYAAIEDAACDPDWLESDETASGYIKNRPFYRTVESSTRIFSTGADHGKFVGYSGEWDYSTGYSCSTSFVRGQKYRVTVEFNSVVMSEIVTAAKYDSYKTRLTGSAFYVEQTPQKYTSSDSDIVRVGIRRTAFGGPAEGGGSKFFTCSVYQETYSYTTLPEEYLDTSFAAPEFSDSARVSDNAADYAQAYMLLYADGEYHRNTFAAAFSSLLAATGLASRVDSLEDTVAAIDTGTASETDSSQNELIASLQAQVESLLTRVAYLESLHTDGDVALSETDGALSFDGAGAEVAEDELVLNSGNVSVVDGELVYGTGDSETTDVDEEGTLKLSGSEVTVDSEGNCDLGTNVTIEDGTITI